MQAGQEPVLAPPLFRQVPLIFNEKVPSPRGYAAYMRIYRSRIAL